MRYIDWHSYFKCAHEVSDIYYKSMAFDGHIFCWDTYMATLLFSSTCTVRCQGNEGGNP